MARKVLEVAIQAAGRDKGKVFRITEMPASKAERWAARSLAALLSSGVDVPEGLLRAGAAALAHFGITVFARMDFDAAQPLLDEMMECVEIKPDPSKPVYRRLIEDDIEELATRFRLRAEVFQLILGFSIPDDLSTSLREMASGVREAFLTPISETP